MMTTIEILGKRAKEMRGCKITINNIKNDPTKAEQFRYINGLLQKQRRLVDACLQEIAKEKMKSRLAMPYIIGDDLLHLARKIAKIRQVEKQLENLGRQYSQTDRLKIEARLADAEKELDIILDGIKPPKSPPQIGQLFS